MRKEAYRRYSPYETCARASFSAARMSSAETFFLRNVTLTNAWLIKNRLWLTGAPRRLMPAVSFAFFVARLLQFGRGHAALLHLADEEELVFGGKDADGVEVAATDVAALILPRHFLDGGVEVEKREEFRDFPSVFPVSRARSRCVYPLLSRRSRECIGEVVGVHVEPLPVLDDLVEEHVLVPWVPAPSREFPLSPASHAAW